MTQLILVLEENPEIQLVIAVSLKESDITISQEIDPDLFVQQASKQKPDLIFISNSDSEQDYKVCREIRTESDLKNTPIILLANAKDEVDELLLSELKINGLLRKPFEASMLQEQLSPFITLDENFGSEPDEDDEDFLIDMSTIENQLKEIKQRKNTSYANGEEEALQMDDFRQSESGLGSDSSPGSHMDSIILDNHQAIQWQPDSEIQEQESSQDENEMRVDVLEESA
ncbi:MAG: response regulator, partial [bacterium]